MVNDERQVLVPLREQVCHGQLAAEDAFTATEHCGSRRRPRPNAQ
ncbi:hypothetical protein ACVCAH_35000 [Micromonospora sp. LZ34]